MSKLDWVKELARAEQRMEETGMVDFTAGFDPHRTLRDETITLLENLREQFVEYSAAFNQMKSNHLSGIKIYGISNTHNDFMLFRNAHKLIFSLREPGLIAISAQTPSGPFPAAGAVTKDSENEDLIEAKWGAFGEIQWTYRQMPIQAESLVRYYLSKFVKESAR